MNGPCSFRQRDVTAAIKATRRAGVEVHRVIVEDGKITLVVGKNDQGEQHTKGLDEWTLRQQQLGKV